jgi:hypothetical protein
MAASQVKARELDPDEARLEDRRARVVSRFRSLAATKHALRAELRASSDWRTQTRRHPYWAAGLSAGMGLLSVFLLRGRGKVASRLLGLAVTAALRHFGKRVSRELSAAR